MTLASSTTLVPAATSVGLFVIVTTAFCTPQARSIAVATSNARPPIHCVFMHTSADHVLLCWHFLLLNGPQFLHGPVLARVGGELPPGLEWWASKAAAAFAQAPDPLQGSRQQPKGIELKCCTSLAVPDARF